MSQTKIVLNRQSDLILDNAEITAPVGIVLADIAGAPEAINALDEKTGANLNTEASLRIAGDAAEASSREAAVSALDTKTGNAMTAEQSQRVAGDANLQNQIDNVLSNVDGAALDSLTEIVGAFQSADDDLNGAIIALSEAATSSLSAEVEARISDVDAEQARAESAEAVLTADLSAERSARILSIAAEVEKEVSNRIADVDAEESRAIEAEEMLAADLSSEVAAREAAISTEASTRYYETARAKAAEASLATFIAAEHSEHIANELSIVTAMDAADSAEMSARIAGVNAEESRAIEAEGSIATDLGLNNGTALLYSTYLAHMVDPELGGELYTDANGNFLYYIDFMQQYGPANLTNFIRFTKDDLEHRIIAEKINVENRAISSEASLASDLSSEASRATTAEASLASDLSSEVAARGNAIDNEASARIDGDQSLQNQIDFITDNTDAAAIDSLTEIVAAFQSADGEINGAITTLADAAGANLSTEVARATSAELVLTNDLSAEVSARIADVDAEESARIAAVNAEASTARAAEGVLTSDLSSEASARIAAVSAEASRATAAEGVLTSDLSSEASARIAAVSAEASRATAAEADLTSDLSKEVSAREAEVSNRIADVDAEESRAMAAEGALEMYIDDATAAESSYRVAGDLSLQNQIDFITENIDPVAIDSLTEIVAAFQTADGDINGAITDLATAAGAGLSTEVARATSAEAVLTANLSAEVSARIADVDAEESRAIAAELDLSNMVKDVEDSLSTEVAARIDDVDAEESRAIEAEGSLATVILVEVSDLNLSIAEQASIRLAADVSIAADLSNEVSNREFDLSSEISARMADVDAEESRATSIEGVLSADLSSEVAARGTAVDAEASYRVSGDLSLQNQIDFITSNVDAAAIDSLTEIVSAFQSADGDINGAITALADAAGANLSTEVERAESAEAVLTSDLSIEVSNRVAAVSALNTKTGNDMIAEISNRIADVDAEESRAMSYELVLNQGIKAEQSRATAAEGVLTSDLSSEVSNRIADVDAEESRAIAAEGVLTSDLSSEVSAREAAMSAEESMRVEADASIAAELSSDIEALADVDGTTIVLNTGTNQIELAEEVAAPASGIRTLMGEIDIETILKVGGVDVMAEISSEISRAEAAEASIAEELSTEVSYLIANTDLGSIDSFAEIVSDLSTEIVRAQSVENDIANTYFQKLALNGDVDGTNTQFDFAVAILPNSESIYLNGLLMTVGDDYSVNALGLTFNNAPQVGDKVKAYGVSGPNVAIPA